MNRPTCKAYFGKERKTNGDRTATHSTFICSASGVAPEATLREGQQHGGVNIVPSTRSTGGEIPVGTLAVPRKQGNG